MFRQMMMMDSGLDLREFDVLAPKKGGLGKAVRALMSKWRSHPAYTGECVCAPCQIN